MIDETDDEWLEHVYQTNVFGPFRFIRESLKVFLPKNDGCIINISSVNGDRPFCGASYTSSKGAINTLTKNVAMRLIDTNIRINAVAPGVIETEMAASIEEPELVRKAIPMRRFGTCEEVAAAVSFLFREESAYRTRQVISVNGGLF